MKTIFLLILVVSTVNTGLGQCIYEDEMISSIRKRYQTINKQKKDYLAIGEFGEKPHTEDDEPDKKTNDSAFFDNGQLRLVLSFQSASYWSTISTVTEYYYWAGHVFFVYRRNLSIRYTQSDCDTNPECAEGQEERFYYCENMCVRYLKRESAGTGKTIYVNLKNAMDKKISCFDLKEDIVSKANELKDNMISKYKLGGINGR